MINLLLLQVLYGTIALIKLEFSRFMVELSFHKEDDCVQICMGQYMIWFCGVCDKIATYKIYQAVLYYLVNKNNSIGEKI